MSKVAHFYFFSYLGMLFYLYIKIAIITVPLSPPIENDLVLIL